MAPRTTSLAGAFATPRCMSVRADAGHEAAWRQLNLPSAILVNGVEDGDPRIVERGMGGIELATKALHFGDNLVVGCIENGDTIAHAYLAVRDQNLDNLVRPRYCRCN